MDQIRVVIAELQLVLEMLREDSGVAPARVKKALEDAIADLKAAGLSITGQDIGPFD